MIGGHTMTEMSSEELSQSIEKSVKRLPDVPAVLNRTGRWLTTDIQKEHLKTMLETQKRRLFLLKYT